MRWRCSTSANATGPRSRMSHSTIRKVTSYGTSRRPSHCRPRHDGPTMSAPTGADTFDYLVVGGGTAGAVVAARLSENPRRRVCLIEAGPSDLAYDEVLKLRRWLELLEGPLDYRYRSTIQPNGNSHIVHSRARVLGGC